MHDTALHIGGLFLQNYAQLDDADVLEIGAYNVNGSLRDHARDGTRWTGVDFEAGPGVDVVTQAGTPLPVEDAAFDVVLASSVFEHDPAFWVTFLDMCRKVRAGGYIYINVPSNGSVHRYPRDNWRFYPDSGQALADWAVSQGQDVVLVESFVAARQRDQWNDFVAIFRKGQPDETDEQRLIHRAVACANVTVWNRPGILNEQSVPEDMALVGEAQAHARMVQQRIGEAVGAHQVVARQLSEANADLESARKSLQQAEAREKALSAERATLARELAKATKTYHGEVAARTQALAQREAQAAQLQSRLAQREEELAQLWRERDDLAGRCELLSNQADKTEARLVDANGWVFQLAGERRAAELETERLQKALAGEKRRCELAEIRAAQWQDRAKNQSAQLDEALQALASAESVRDRAAEEWAQTQAKLRQSDASLHLARSELHRRFSELAQLTRLLDERHRHTEDQRQQIEAAMARLAQAEALHTADREQLSRELGKAEERQQLAEEASSLLARTMTERSHEIASLSAMLHQTEQALAAKESRRAHIAEIASIVMRGTGGGRSVWTRWLPGSAKAERLAQTLKDNGLFDPDAYLDAYPDVAAAGENPLRHYLIHGVREGRSAHNAPNGTPSPDGRP